MTDEQIRERDPRPDPEDGEPPEPDEEERNPWTREGADAPDAADIEEPDEQR